MEGKKETAEAPPAAPPVVVHGLVVPEGYTVSRTGNVYGRKNGGFIVPCPVCGKKWVTKGGKSCLDCFHAQPKKGPRKPHKKPCGKTVNKTVEKPVEMSSIPTVTMDALVEEIALQIVAKAKARAAEILGLTI